jgi:hypothetical protein
MFKTCFSAAAVVAVVLAASVCATQPAEAGDGCGANRYRGPGGACHMFGTGPYPGGFYGPRVAANGCPPGYWYGPWGHCRDTPYHGRLPGGGWK